MKINSGLATKGHAIARAFFWHTGLVVIIRIRVFDGEKATRLIGRTSGRELISELLS